MRLSVVLGVLAGFAIGLAAGLLLAGVLRTVRPEELRLAEALKSSQAEVDDLASKYRRQIEADDQRRNVADGALAIDATIEGIKAEFAKLSGAHAITWTEDRTRDGAVALLGVNIGKSTIVTIETQGKSVRRVTLSFRVVNNAMSLDAMIDEMGATIHALMASLNAPDLDRWVREAIVWGYGSEKLSGNCTFSRTRLGLRLALRANGALGGYTITADSPAASWMGQSP